MSTPDRVEVSAPKKPALVSTPSKVFSHPTFSMSPFSVLRCALTWEWLKSGGLVNGEDTHVGIKETLQNEMTQGECGSNPNPSDANAGW